jgi:hypothetical protein
MKNSRIVEYIVTWIAWALLGNGPVNTLPRSNNDVTLQQYQLSRDLFSVLCVRRLYNEDLFKNYGREIQGTRTRERLRWRGPTAYTKDRAVLSLERAPHKNKTVTVK